MIYFFFFFSLYIFSLSETCTTITFKKYKNLSIVFLFTFFVVLAGCRYKTGYDWNAYMTYFDRIRDMTVFHLMEVGYASLNYMFKTVFDSYAAMNFIIVLVNTIILFNFCKRYSPLPITSLLFYGGNFFFTFNMGLTRQYIALSISLIVIHFIFQHRNVLAFFFIVLACLFHKSAIVTVLFFLCYKIHLKKRSLLIGVVLSIIITFLGNAFVRMIVAGIFSLPFLPDFILDYQVYLYHEIWGGQSEFSSGLGYLSILLIVFSGYLFFHNDSEVSNFVFNAVLVGLLIAAFGKNITIFARLAKYFDWLQMIVFVYLIQAIKRRLLPSLYPVILGVLLLYCVAIPYKFTHAISEADGKESWSMFYPWQSIFFPVENTDRNQRMQRINSLF